MGSVVLNGATSGATTLQPTDATTQTITLPANSGTVITTASSGKVIPTAALPAGTVLQVVQGVSTSIVSSSSATQVSTGCTATITPTSATSKILVIPNGTGRTANGGWSTYSLYKNGSIMFDISPGYNYSFSSTASTILTFVYLDSPATTSATTYTLYFNNNSNAPSQWNPDGQRTTMTLMEIAA